MMGAQTPVRRYSEEQPRSGDPMAKEDDRTSREVNEAQRILKQVEHDSQSLLLGGMPSHSSSGAEDRDKLDDTEILGRRIGRTLAIAFAVAIVLWFLLAPASA